MKSKEKEAMFASVHSRPRFAERARCHTARMIVELSLVLGRLAAFVLPREHPARLYIIAEIERQRPQLVGSIVPAGGTVARRVGGVATALLVWAIFNGVMFHGDKGPADALAALIDQL